MSVADRWHTRNPRIVDGEPVKPCREHKLYPSSDHGQGDRWQVRWRDPDTGQQKKANRAKLGGAKGEGNPDVYARALDAKLQAEIQTDTYIDPSAGEVELQDYAKQWRADYVADPATLESLDRQLAHIYDVEAGPRSRRAPGTSTIGPKPMRWLAKRPSAIKGWVKSLEAKGLSAGYINNIIGTLSSIFNAAIDDGIVAANPVKAKSVKRLPVTKKKVVPWTRSMVDAAAAELEKRFNSGAMAYLGAGAGLRESEVFAIADGDITFLGTDRKITVRRQVKRMKNADGKYVLVFCPPKRHKEREVPLSDELGARLARHLETCPPTPVTLPWERPDGRPHTAKLLFVRRDGQAWYRNTFAFTWNLARAEAGAPPPPDERGRFHYLRHTYASACLSGGADIRDLAAWLGHDDPGFTLRTYIHLMPGAASKGRKAVDAFLTEPEVDDGQSALNVPSAER